MVSNSEKEYPHVAVIMLNWNTPEMTGTAIKSVLQSDYPEFSVHITDNGSKDNSYEILGMNLETGSVCTDWTGTLVMLEG